MTAASPIRTLRRYLPGTRVERCALCGVKLAGGHRHLMDVKTRQLSCACDACALLLPIAGKAVYGAWAGRRDGWRSLR